VICPLVGAHNREIERLGPARSVQIARAIHRDPSDRALRGAAQIVGIGNERIDDQRQRPIERIDLETHGVGV